ncbi:MAG: ChbG/HpnK family deacetylase [Kiritimatiellaeota bacterium]|nr:ChbG/HpnK family deacetylase [Kiritimatiellota bacterium]
MMICADDFGLAPDVDEAIVSLAAGCKISAVSVMAALLAKPSPALKALLDMRSQLEIGLHLVMTDEANLPPSEHVDSLHRNGRFLSFGNLLSRSLTGGVRAADAQREISAQYEWFESLTESAPDFVDGHLHVQQLPGVRRGLVEFLTGLPPNEQPWVRNAAEPMETISKRGVAPLKCWAIAKLGGALRERLQARHIPTNDGFAGVCDYGNWQNYPDALQRMLAHVRPGNYLIMTHPGQSDDWRRAEFEALLAVTLPAGEPQRFARKQAA